MNTPLLAYIFDGLQQWHINAATIALLVVVIAVIAFKVIGEAILQRRLNSKLCYKCGDFTTCSVVKTHAQSDGRYMCPTCLHEIGAVRGNAERGTRNSELPKA